MVTNQALLKVLCSVFRGRRAAFLVMFAVCALVGGVASPSWAADPCPDGDGDKWGVDVAGCDDTGLDGVGDCNDGDAAINPAAAEVCGDGVDNDCDGDVDFGLNVNDFGPPPVAGEFDTGTCFLADPPGCEAGVDFGDPPSLPETGCCLTAGHKVCNADNTGVVCENNAGPGEPIRIQEPEGPGGDGENPNPTCFDGGDQDCDGLHDHEDPDCQTEEFCNGFDDDNNGLIDDGFPTLGDPCTVGQGECERTGVIVCDDVGGTECNRSPGNPKTEATPGEGRCVDGLDNDCDGATDLADTGCQQAELCDGLDNDGDGDIDEDFVGLGDPCSVGTGVCQGNGVFVCTADGAGTMCNAVLNLGAASPEGPSGATCGDGIDNDCDDLVDGEDPGCGSANIGATCSLELLQQVANGASCEGFYRIHFETFGAGDDAQVFSELVALDTNGDQLALLPVENMETAHLVSRLDPEDWKFRSRRNRRRRGPLAGPGNWHEVFAPVPLLRVRVKDSLNEAVAYCSPIPWLDVVRPDGAVADGTNGNAVVDVLAALPLVKADSLSVLVNGVDILAALGIDPATAFPGTHPGGVVLINGENVTISDIVVDIAPDIEVLSSNTLRMKIEGLACGGNEVVVDGMGMFPPGTVEPVTEDCNVDDIHDCGSSAVFDVQISSPFEGQITNVVPTPVTGEVCHGLEVVQASINGKQLPTDDQTFTASDGECAGGTFQLTIDTALGQTNLFAEAIGMNAEVGTFDLGSNLLIASAADEEGHRVFRRLVFAVGEPSDIISGAAAPLAARAAPVDLDWDFDFDFSRSALRNARLVSGTAIVDSFVLGMEGEALSTFFAEACEDATADVEAAFVEEVCALDETSEADSPCCNPDVRVTTVGCDTPDGPEFLGTFDCSVAAMDGPGPDGTGGKLVVTIGIPRVQFDMRARGDCHGGFLWGCNTDVDMTVEITFPHPGNCEGSGKPECPDPNDPDEDCCVPTQPLNQIVMEIEEQDFEAGTPEECACVEGDTDCEAAPDCCDPGEPGCITGTLVKSGVIQIRKLSGGIDVGGWNIVLAGIILFGALGLIFGPFGLFLGALIGGLLGGLLFGAVFGGSFDFSKDILQDVDVGQITLVVKDVEPEAAPYEATGLEVDTELSSVSINMHGLTVRNDIGIAITMPDPDVDPSLGYYMTGAAAPMPPVEDPSNTFVAFSDDLFNAIFEAIRRQGQITSETCGGTLAEGACCESADLPTVGDLFPADCNELAVTGTGADAFFVGACFGIRAAALPEPDATALCESFMSTAPVLNAVAKGQGACHGVRGANCSDIGTTIPGGNTERLTCLLTPSFNIAANDPILLCARAGTEPSFRLADRMGTDAVESMLRLNDLLSSIVVDRGDDGYQGLELTAMPTCFADGTDDDCRFIGVCLDLSVEASMLLVAGTDGPEVQFELGEPMVQERPEGEICEGGANLPVNSDLESAGTAADNDTIREDLRGNAADSVPVQTPDNINLGDIVQFEAPELAAIKTSAGFCKDGQAPCESDADCLGTPPMCILFNGVCEDDPDTPCNDDGGCGGAEPRCVIFQDYLVVRGRIAEVP